MQFPAANKIIIKEELRFIKNILKRGSKMKIWDQTREEKNKRSTKNISI
jgi:hypothetical protein